MIKSSKVIIISLIFICIFFGIFISAQNAIASNRLLDFKAVSTKESSIFLFLLEDRPRFSLKPIEKNKILLTVLDTSKSSRIDLLTADNKLFSINEDAAPSELLISLNLDKPLYEVSSSWLSDDKVLLLEISYAKESSEQPDISKSIPDLKNIRFGFMENATRMVMSLDREPSWELTYKEPATVTIEIAAASGSLKEKSYGPIKWVQKVDVNKEDDRLINLNLQLDSQMSRISIFWMKIGNRLVLDLFNEPAKIYSKNLLAFNSRKDSNDHKLTDTDAITKNGFPDSEISPFPETENYVRMKIPVNGKSPSESDSTVHRPLTQAGDKSLTVHPKMDYNLPGTPFESKLVQDLGSEEAYLFGRIQQALEINDFNTGIELTKQFITQFPSSALIEKMLFWQGDFYYSLWKSGDEDASEKVITSYRSAVDHFGNSEYAPLAYIKMAQASSSKEKHFPAIGYLSLLISKKKAGNFLPLAYLSRGKIYLKTNQSEKAINDFKKILDNYPKSNFAIEARFWVANYYHAIGMYEEAEKRLNEIVESNYELYLEYPEYLFLSAKNNLYLEKFNIARDFLFKGLNIGGQPESIDLLLSRIGDTYHNEKNEKEAEKYYRMVIDYYPKSEGSSIATLRLADYFSDITMLDDLQREVTDEPLSDLAVLEKGYQLFERKQYADVMANVYNLTVKPVKTETRQDAKLLFYKAAEKEVERLYADHKYKELIDMYGPVEKKLNNNIDPATVLLVAEAYNNLKLYSDAVNVYLKIKPYDLNQSAKGKYIYGLADVYINAGYTDQAQNLLERSSEDKLDRPERQKITLLLAEIFVQKGMHEKAYTLYESMLQNKSKPPENDLVKIYFAMGKILRARNSMERAEYYINKAIQIAQSRSDLQNILQAAHMELGLLHYSKGNYSHAAKSLENGFSLGYSPEKDDYWENRFMLASAYLEEGENSKAAPLLSEISEEGDILMQQKAQIRIGAIDLEEQMKRLSINE